ncbi:ATP-binding protein [Geodermatophilus sp. SYSU D00815]
MVGPPPGAAEGARLIPTPDQRLRVFVSSTMVELAEERIAVREAVSRLRLIPVLFELGARTHPPRNLYRSYLAQSDVFVGIYGERYGWVAPGMEISGLEDEYELSAGMPRLLYVRRSAPGREPRLQELIDRMQAEGDTSTTFYDDAAQLGDLVSDDLAVLLSERFARPRPPPGLAPAWLPTPAAPLVGRHDELALVTGLLRDPTVRLVTLTGPGGTGKTRLALEAAEVLTAERDAVWWVDLSPVRDAAEVPGAVAAAVGVPAEGVRSALDLVADRLAGRAVLLVVDNAEHVAGAAPELGRLLSRCPRTQLLVTSRSLLGLRGEHDVPLGPLPVPAAGERRYEAVTAAPAVQLFSARARRADPSFTVTETTAPAVAEVVRRLDGLPLALELAAARVRTMPPAVLLRRLSAALDPVLDLPDPEVDVPDRQRTLRATLVWSHELLGGPERALLARLSVCTGGCTLDTAEAIGALGGDLDVAETLAELVAHSLVAATDTGEGEPRFRMLGLVRVFAAQQLRDRGEEEAVRRRLAEHLARVSTSAGAGLLGPERRLWRARLDAETADLLAALRWAVAHDRADLVLRIAAPLTRWWWSRGLVGPLAEIAEQTAALPSAGLLPPGERARLHWARGLARIAGGRGEEAAPLLAAVVADARERRDPWLLGHGLVGVAGTRAPEDPRLPELLAEAVDALRRSGDGWSVAYALVPLGEAALQAGDLPAAGRAHEEALALARATGDEHLVATVLDHLGADAVLAGDLVRARERLFTAAELHRQVRDQEGLANCLDGLAGLVLALGLPRAAARLAGAADAARAAIGVTMWPLRRSRVDRLAAAIRLALGEDDEPRERAAGAAAGPWAALDAGLAAVEAAEDVAGGHPGDAAGDTAAPHVPGDPRSGPAPARRAGGPPIVEEAS